MKIFTSLPLSFATSKTKPSPVSAIQGRLKRASDKADGRISADYAKCRIERELRLGLKDPPLNCSYGPIGDNIFQWEGAIMGPSDTPFVDGVFFLSIEFTAKYPFVAPKIKFKTKVFHPNISHDGTIYVDILGPQWTPALTIDKVLLSICSLLPDPSPDQYPMNPVCKLYSTNRKAYNKKAREWTRMYAMG